LSRAKRSAAISDDGLNGSKASARVMSNTSVVAAGTNFSPESAITTRRHEGSASAGVCSIIDSSLTAINRLVCSARSR
jgi:hypothetical protein